MINVQQARCFLAVAEELHFGRAAARLHLAQPPLSRTIKQLERELGTRLFDRNTRTVRLTASGSALVQPARDLLEAARRAGEAAQSAAGDEVGTVRIAFAGLSTHGLVASLARRIRLRHPGIRLELSSQNFAMPAMRLLLNGDSDLALGRWDVVPASIHAEVALPDSLVMAMPASHPLSERQRISIHELKDSAFISLPPHEGAVLPDRLRQLSKERGFVADIVQLAPDTQTALALVSAEVGCHLTLETVSRVASDPHIRFVPLQEPAHDVDLRAAWRDADRSPATGIVIRTLRSLRADRLPT